MKFKFRVQENVLIISATLDGSNESFNVAVNLVDTSENSDTLANRLDGAFETIERYILITGSRRHA